MIPVHTHHPSHSSARPFNTQPKVRQQPFTMHAALIGASRGIGYHVTLNLLATSDWTCTLLLRRPEIIEQDDKLAPYINEGKLSLIQGNGTNDANVAKLFEQHVDLLVTTIGKLFNLFPLYPTRHGRMSS